MQQELCQKERVDLSFASENNAEDELHFVWLVSCKH